MALLISLLSRNPTSPNYLQISAFSECCENLVTVPHKTSMWEANLAKSLMEYIDILNYLFHSLYLMLLRGNIITSRERIGHMPRIRK